MSQYEQELKAAQSAITLQYKNAQNIIDDIQNKENSHIVDQIYFKDQSQLQLFRRVIIQIFKHKNYEIKSIKLSFFFCFF